VPAPVGVAPVEVAPVEVAPVGAPAPPLVRAPLTVLSGSAVAPGRALRAAVMGRRQAESETVGEVASVARRARTLAPLARRSIGPVAPAAVSALVAVAAPIVRPSFSPILPAGP